MKNHKNNKSAVEQKKPAVVDRILKNESGVALIVVLVLLVIMISFIPVAMQLTAKDIERTADFQQAREAFFIAEAGLEMGKALVQGNPSSEILKGPNGNIRTETGCNGTFSADAGSCAQTSPVQDFIIAGSTTVSETSSIDGNNYSFTQVSFNGGTYKVRIFDNDDSAMCPTGCTAGNTISWLNTNLEAYNDRDGKVYIEAIGETSMGTKKRIVASVKRKTLNPSSIPGAVVLVGPKAKAQSGAGAYGVHGSEQTGANAGSGFAIDGSADPECPGVNALAIEADNPGYTNTAPGPLTSCNDNVCVRFGVSSIGGLEGTSEDGTQSTSADIKTNDIRYTANDAADLYEDIITNGTPDTTVVGDKNIAPGSAVTLGTLADPEIVYITGNLVIGGNLTGYGILVVDGDIQMSGQLAWEGIILVGACPTCTGDLTGLGTFSSSGTVVIGNSSSDYAQSTFQGTASFDFSCEGLAIANNTLDDTFAVNSWKEVN